MASLINALSSGFQVYAKTQFGPEIEVYDSQAAPAPPGILQTLTGPIGMQIRDESGNVVASYGEWPDTNPLAVAAIVGLVALAGYVAYRGIK